MYLAHAGCWSFPFWRPSVQRQSATRSVHWRLQKYYRNVSQSRYTAQWNERRYLHRKHFLIVWKGIQNMGAWDLVQLCGVLLCKTKLVYVVMPQMETKSGRDSVRIVPIRAFTLQTQDRSQAWWNFGILSLLTYVAKDFFPKKTSSEWILFELWYALNQKQKVQALWKPQSLMCWFLRAPSPELCHLFTSLQTS